LEATMKMSRRYLPAAALAVAGACASTLAAAQPLAQSFPDSARVLSATPIYDRVSEPRQVCSTEYQTRAEAPSEPSAPVGAIAGGVIGGLIGHQFGSGRGNTAATIGGAVAGAAVGSQYDRGSQTHAEPSTREVQRCETVGEARDVIRGYSVVYDYRGHQFTTELPYDPGQRLDVAVTIAPQPR
jgi:uncharacterized protein YcfJ